MQAHDAGRGPGGQPPGPPGIFLNQRRQERELRPMVVSLTGSAHGLARRIAEILDADHDDRAAGAVERLQGYFAAGLPIVGVCAAGILVRALGPVLRDKWAEPPVLAVAEDGSSVVPLLGGHHGANALAVRLAEALEAHAAITTAGDLGLGVALDAPPPGWRLDNPLDAKAAAAGLLNGAEGV